MSGDQEPERAPQEHGGALSEDEHLEDETPEDRRRVLVIAAFVTVSLAVAIVLAILYGMPSAP
ncbi:MAG: hypothetical protein J2P45_05990 [Candidatus Dormibacteraeota bacterium]|nr:hypothetical protein [Candidatus Dormibacteraeota bacterium]